MVWNFPFVASNQSSKCFETWSISDLGFSDKECSISAAEMLHLYFFKFKDAIIVQYAPLLFEPIWHKTMLPLILMENHFLLLFFFVYLRRKETKNPCSLVYCPNIHKCWREPVWEPRTQYRSPIWVEGTQLFKPSPLPPRVCTIKKQVSGPELEIELRLSDLE